jgi:Asp-tRNA(Asn)/Glu-tRNA(Gln) amidotransferase C subunit
MLRNGTAEARHMTSDESLDEGAKAQWRTNIKEFHELAKPIFKKKREDIDEYYRNLVVQEKTRIDEEKRREAQEKKAQAAAEKEEAAWRREMANVAKYAEDYEAALKKQALREEKKKKAAKDKVAKKRAAKGKGRHIEPSSEESDEFEDEKADKKLWLNFSSQVGQQKEQRRPVPRARTVRSQPAVEAETEEDSPAEPGPSTPNVLVSIPVSGTTGVALPSTEPTPAPRYTLRTRKGR